MAAVIIQALLLPRTPHLRPAHRLLLEYQKGHGRKMSHTIRAKCGLGYYVLCFSPPHLTLPNFFRTTLKKSQHNLWFVLTQALKWAKSLRFTWAINVHLLIDVSSPIKRQRDRSSDIFYYGLWLISNLLLSACHSRRHSSIYLFHHFIS